MARRYLCLLAHVYISGRQVFSEGPSNQFWPIDQMLPYKYTVYLYEGTIVKGMVSVSILW